MNGQDSSSSTTSSSPGGLPPAKLYHPKDQVLFVKDTDASVYSRVNTKRVNKAKFQQLGNNAREYGFSCGNQLESAQVIKDTPEALNETIVLNVGHKATIGNYNVGKRHLQDWVDNDMSLAFRGNFTMRSSYSAKEFIPVCLGGHFMATVERIQQAPVPNWDVIIQSLAQDQDGEQSRFMERLWAGLLSPPLPDSDTKALLLQDYRIIKRTGRYKGIIMIQKKYETPVPTRKRKGWKAKRDALLIPWQRQVELTKKY
jgi:hypothetical protein